MIPLDDGREFYAVNLETLKHGPEAEQSDRAYARIVMPLLFKRASHPVFVSRRAGLPRQGRGAGLRYRPETGALRGRRLGDAVEGGRRRDEYFY